MGAADPSAHGFGRALGIARNDGVVAVEQQASDAERDELVEVDELHACDIAPSRDERHV